MKPMASIKPHETLTTSLECVVLEWEKTYYLLPISRILEAFVFDAKAYTSASATYRWGESEVPCLTLNGKSIDPQSASRKKIAILYANEGKPVNATSGYRAICFENEAKQLTVRESELTWQESAKHIALLSQPRLTLPVVIFQTAQITP